MKKVFYIFFLATAFTSCQKCNLKGDSILNESFDAYGEWLLYSEYSATDEFYSRIENGALKLRTNQQFEACQRATYYFQDDFSDISGFQVCIKLNQLILPKDVDVHFYFSLGDYEMHAVIEKKKAKNNLVIFRVDDKGVSSNHRGAIFGKLGNEIEQDNYSTNFVQISLCPESEAESTGEMYIEIDAIEINILD